MRTLGWTPWMSTITQVVLNRLPTPWTLKLTIGTSGAIPEMTATITQIVRIQQLLRIPLRGGYSWKYDCKKLIIPSVCERNSSKPKHPSPKSRTKMKNLLYVFQSHERLPTDAGEIRHWSRVCKMLKPNNIKVWRNSNRMLNHSWGTMCPKVY